jgi:hypothetical protein
MRALWLAAAAAACVTPAFAADITRTSAGYTYFNRPGADFAAHDADIAACRKIAGRLHQPMQQMTYVSAGGGYGAIGAAIGIAIAQAISDARAHPTNVENCMVVRGWRVVSIDKEEGAALVALDKKVRLEKVSAWIGAETPHGQVVRTFDNELATAPPSAIFVASSNFGNTAVSADLATKPRETAASAATSQPYMAKSARPPKPLKAQDLGGVPEGAGLVVVSVVGSGEITLGFERVGPEADTPAWTDGHPGSFEVRQATGAFASANGGQGQMLAFAVPPGRWRLAYEEDAQTMVSYCLGAPAFDIAAGDVIYAGSFSPDAMGHPDLSPEPAKSIFPALSGIADKLQPAKYVNGVQGACQGAYAYALEMAGQPFADGYGWGTRASPPTAAPSQSVTATAAEVVPAPSSAPPSSPSSTPQTATPAPTPPASTPSSTQ